jgi:sulfur carrier protein
MQLTVNGEPLQLAEHQTVRDLIERLGLGGRAVAVEVNKKLVPKKQHESTRLQPGDQVEIVTLVGGG